ncbi:MAG: MFS transporter [Deltaproteobacteria bacterium]|nr:MFS transporter [Candidatus Zymogenaceae bacterium]
MNRDNKLSVPVKIGFGAGEFSSSVFFTVTTVILMIFLTDNVGLSATLAGTALLIGKLWDAVIDPVIGYLSDRTRTRMGRRRPWLLFAALPFAITFALMFRNPGLSSQTSLFIWTLLSFMALSTAYPCANIPYNSLLPDLTRDFNERTSVTGYKTVFAVAGTLIGAGAAVPLIGLFSSKDAGYFGMGVIFAVLIVISVLSPFFAVKEPPLPTTIPKQGIFSSYRDAFGNRPFVLILTVWMLNTIGVGIVMASMIYYFKYVFLNEALITPILLVLVLTAVIFVPITVRVSEKIGKRETYIIGMFIAAAAIMTFSFVAHIIGVTYSAIIIFFAGIGFSTHYILPWSMIPDTIEYDYSRYGTRREGIFYGLWVFVIKVGGALSGFIVGFMLDAFGYIPNLVHQPALSLTGMRLLVGPLTAVFFIAANIVLWFYPINRKAYDEIMAKIRKMESTTG